MTILSLLLLFASLLHATHSSTLQNTMTLTLLNDAAANDGAVCLDGTPGAYYFTPGTGDGVNRWFLWFEGGGWCESLEQCYKRSSTALGSSKDYTSTINLPSGYFSALPSVNPLAYNWNKVYFKYCDGGSFSGNNETVQEYAGKKLYYRGFRILQAYAEDLLTNHGMDKGTHFLISGCSAGGLATYLHVDWWANKLPRGSVVKGMPDSGFFLDYNSNDRNYSSSLRWVFDAMNSTSGVNEHCILTHQSSPSDCIFAEHTSPHILTPIFPLQSVYDAWQVNEILGVSTNDTLSINNYGALVTKRFSASVLGFNPSNGAFLDSCYHHCGEWDLIKIDGRLAGEAVALWYGQSRRAVYVQGEGYPCEKCCSP